MTNPILETPFGDEPLEEIDLRSPPIVRVIAQLRFPQLTSMMDDTVVNAFTKEVSSSYPIQKRGTELNLIITGGIESQKEQQSSPIWRFRTADDNWLVTL